MAALVSPTCDAERLTWLACWTAFGFLVDDELDDGPLGRDLARCQSLIGDLTSVLDGRPDNQPADGGALRRAMDDLWHRIVPGRSLGWIRSARMNAGAWLSTYSAETADRVADRLPGVAEYRLHRRDSVAGLLYMDLVEAMIEIDLPETVRQLPQWQALRAFAADHVGLCNDIYSARKESDAGYGHNMVALIRADQNCDIRSAAHRANAMATGYMREFLDAETQLLAGTGLPPDTRVDAAHCARAYRAIIRGNFDYHLAAPRYRDR
ncbi:terpene synthase family protein [Streptomyces sp. NPDC091280]|uniref:terpene synthase family protein n=1 Tax=Streptomyces sp. NPDC091280 TaxID=3365984 RepID=UPI00381EC4A5